MKSNEYCKYNSIILNKIDPLFNITDSVIYTNELTVLSFEKDFSNFQIFLSSKRKLNNYGRQYFTFVKNNRKYLFVNFINFSNKELKKLYSNEFNKTLIIGFGQIFENNTFVILYDLDEKSFKLY